MKKALILVPLAVAVAGALFVAGIAVYQSWFHPVARLARAVSEGDSMSSARASFAEYCGETLVGSEDFCELNGIGQVVGWEHVCDGQSKQFLHAYSWFFMDDIQLYVFGGADGQVCDSVFWAD